MKTRRAICWTLLVLAVVAIPAAARAESSSGGSFRLPGYGARAYGMGGAIGAIIDDESCVEWNPAALGFAGRLAGVSYVNLVPGLSIGQSQAVYTTPFGKSDRNGVSRHAAGVMYTNLSADVAGGESYSENHLRLSYAFTPEPVLSLGVSARAFMSSSGVTGFDAHGTSVDFSVRAGITRGLTFAFIARDVFSRYDYDDGRDYQIESEYVLSLASTHVRGIRIGADAARSYGMWSRGMLGAETDYLFSTVALRAGATLMRAGDTRTVPSFGASVRAFDARVALHYAASLDEDTAFGTAHRVSLAVRL